MDTTNSNLRLDVALTSLGLSAEYPPYIPPLDPLFCVHDSFRGMMKEEE
jgi:hypothetical protein